HLPEVYATLSNGQMVAFTGGVQVAAGDLLGDGFADVLVTSAGPAGGGELNAFNGSGQMVTGLNFVFPFGAAYQGGASVAAGDVLSVGRAQLLISAGPSATGPAVAVFDAASGTLAAGPLVPFGSGFLGGVRVSVATVNTQAEIVTAPGPTGAAAL